MCSVCKEHNDFSSLNLRVKMKNPNYINILCRIQTLYGSDICFAIPEFLDIESDSHIKYNRDCLDKEFVIVINVYHNQIIKP